MNLQTMVLFGVFFFLTGACIGSFLNVVIWRLPYRGREVLFLEKQGRMTLSWPPSHCPVCDAPIAWHNNIPVLSWFALRGRCANCRTAIPIRYPLVELGTAVLFLGLFLAYFVAGWQAGGAGGGIGAWPHANLNTDWPPFVLHLVFAAALLAAAAIDADLFIIPLAIPWFLALLGIVASASIGPPLTRPFSIVPNLSSGTWWLAKPVLGMVAGLVLANVLMMLKVLPRSFDEELEEHGSAPPPPASTPTESGPPDKKPKGSQLLENKSAEPAKGSPLVPLPKLTRYWPAVVAAILVLGLAGLSWGTLLPRAAALATLCGGILIFLIGVLPRDADQVDITDEVMEEISSPHVRREIFKELLFLAVPGVCGVLAYVMPLEVPRDPWIGRALGSLLGLLVGGGVVWMIRVAGSLGFGKEAMGTGDAHLMAGVGAVIGAPLVVVAFFTAPFLGILWAIVLKFMGKPSILPYGPWLAVASILMLLLGNPIIGFVLSLGMVAGAAGGGGGGGR